MKSKLRGASSKPRFGLLRAPESTNTRTAAGSMAQTTRRRRALDAGRACCACVWVLGGAWVCAVVFCALARFLLCASGPPGRWHAGPQNLTQARRGARAALAAASRRRTRERSMAWG